MTDKGLGMTAIVDDRNSILGIFTDGDLRRTLDSGSDIRTTTIRDIMHTNCKTTTADVLAAEALHLLEENKITSLLVADDDGVLVGALNIHDLFREGLM
jgi:arabinose-5-phosphate isomerase